MHRLLSAATLILALAAPAIAQPDPDRDRRELAEVAAAMPAPGPGLAKASPRAPAWCATAKVEGSWTPRGIGRLLDTRRILDAASVVCHWANETASHGAAAVIVQHWINTTGLTEARAIESLTARLSKEAFAADKERLCADLGAPDELVGGEHAFAVARAVLFGCPQGGSYRVEPMWLQPGALAPTNLASYVDTRPDDEIVRLALVLSRTRIALPDSTPTDRSVTTYAVDQIDYATVTAETVARGIEAEPYRGNTYARVVAFESLGQAKLAIAVIEADVARRAKDEGWREILVDAPKRGVARWNALVAKHGDAIRRSNDFEIALTGRSASKAKAKAKGCWDVLSADFLAIARTLDRSSAKAFEQDLSEPMPSLLLPRLAACAAIEGNAAQSAALIERAGSPVRGPRVAAYREALAALGAVVEDRPRFPVDTFYRMEIGSVGGAHGGGYNDPGHGDIKSVQKTADGVRVTFVRRAYQERVIHCVATNRIVKIHATGDVQYYQRCRDTGKQRTVVTTAEPIVIPSAWAGGITPGVALEFATNRDRRALPIAAMKSGRLVNWLGLAL
jgi:hypothetical protein